MNPFSFIGGIQLFLRSDVWNSDPSWPFVSIALFQSLVIGSNKVGWGDLSEQSVSPTLLLLCRSLSYYCADHSPTTVQITLLLLCRSLSAQTSCIYVYFIFFYLHFIRYCNKLCIIQWKWILVLYRFQLIINITTLTEAQPTHQSYTNSKILLMCQYGAQRWQSNIYRTDSTVHSHAMYKHNQTTAAYLIVSKESCGTRELSRLTWSWCPSIQPICGRLR